MKYRVEVESFCTRFVKRVIMINANNNDEASVKAIDKFINREYELPNCSDFGNPEVKSIEIVE